MKLQRIAIPLFTGKKLSIAVSGLLMLVALLFNPVISSAQSSKDTAKKVPVEIMQPGGTEYLEVVQTDSGSINKLIGEVKLKQGETLMYCDSAYLNIQTNNVEAFGNVLIIQPDGTQASSDYLLYKGNSKLAYMKGNVNLTDGTDNLWSEEVTYDMSTKIGTYNLGGTLQTGNTTLSSNEGNYNLRNKDARFIHEVYVYDPEYNIVSRDLGYNTETKVTRFFDSSTVISDKSILKTRCGYYDTKNEIAHFPCRSSMDNEGQYIEADSIHYNKKSGVGKAVGDVIAIDTSQHTTLYSGIADINETKKEILATIKPVLKQQSGKDSLFIRADTFYSAQFPIPEDTMYYVKTIGKGKSKRDTTIRVADTMTNDSSRARFFIGYHNVLIYSDSLQGKCDSISYTQSDSAMRMMYNPILWSRKSQITGDTIVMYMDSSELKRLYVPNNAFTVSQSGPDKAQLFDQVQGKTLTGNFEDNAIKDMLVKPNAEAIYYAQDDYGAYIGVNEITSERMKILFNDEQLDKIIFEQEVKHKMTPLDQADLENLKLNRFQWLIDQRPMSKEELFK